MDNNSGAARTSLADLKKGALEHYEDLATKCHHWYSFIPQAIEAYQEWINVNDGLPDNGQQILFWTSGFSTNRLCLGTFLFNDPFERKNMFCDGAFFATFQVSHWMKAPQHPDNHPPKELIQ